MGGLGDDLGPEVGTDVAKERVMTRNSKRLTPEQRGVLRQALVVKRAELLRGTGCFEHDRADIEVDSAELEDIAEGVVEDRVRARIDDHDRSLLEDIDRALAKLDAGTYGLSEASLRPIPFERLQAVPWARYAVEEAKWIERAFGKMGHRSTAEYPR
jgi:DnaK suppressor protein